MFFFEGLVLPALRPLQEPESRFPFRLQLVDTKLIDLFPAVHVHVEGGQQEFVDPPLKASNS